jgi:hypothetical protein
LTFFGLFLSLPHFVFYSHEAKKQLSFCLFPHPVLF